MYTGSNYASHSQFIFVRFANKKKKQATPMIPVPSQWKQQSLPKNIVANLLSVSVPMVKFHFLILLSSKTTRYWSKPGTT